MLGGLIGTVVNVVGGIIDKSITDKDKAAELKHSMTLELLKSEDQLVQSAGEIIKTEASSEHTVTATWRPILMLSITAILVNNFLLAPYMQAIFGWSVFISGDLATAVPEGLWNLLTVGVGGYIVGRSAEKGIKNWKKNDNG